MPPEVQAGDGEQAEAIRHVEEICQGMNIVPSVQ